ncbi:MAG: hypothetical protein LBS74_06020 [Oscillospiraceae bacterium]|jgi:hypothetical protein|nr:hypothetical protein [Oscillospiraceae bacterium]
MNSSELESINKTINRVLFNNIRVPLIFIGVLALFDLFVYALVKPSGSQAGVTNGPFTLVLWFTIFMTALLLINPVREIPHMLNWYVKKQELLRELGLDTTIHISDADEQSGNDSVEYYASVTQNYLICYTGSVRVFALSDIEELKTELFTRDPSGAKQMLKVYLRNGRKATLLNYSSYDAALAAELSTAMEKQSHRPPTRANTAGSRSEVLDRVEERLRNALKIPAWACLIFAVLVALFTYGLFSSIATGRFDFIMVIALPFILIIGSHILKKLAALINWGKEKALITRELQSAEALHLEEYFVSITKSYLVSYGNSVMYFPLKDIKRASYGVMRTQGKHGKTHEVASVSISFKSRAPKDILRGGYASAKAADKINEALEIRRGSSSGESTLMKNV